MRVWLPSTRRCACVMLSVAAILGLLGFTCANAADQPPASGSPPLKDAHEVWLVYGNRTANLIKSVLNDQTLLARERAAQMPGVEPRQIQSVEPAVRQEFVLTGKKKDAVLSVKCDAAGPVLNMAKRDLPVGCYAVRVIAMVETNEIQQYRKPLYVELLVQGPQGVLAKRYRQRVPYWDDFYSVTELYVNVDVPGEYQFSVRVGDGSAVPLMINRLELHDVLKPLPQVAVKARPSLWTQYSRDLLRKSSDPQQVLKRVERLTGKFDDYIAKPESTPQLSPEAQFQRDKALWNAMPTINSQFIGFFPTAFPQKQVTQPEVVVKTPAYLSAGAWKWPSGSPPWLTPLEIVNEKLNLKYSQQDFDEYRPLPSPYPWPDNGGGIYIPADTDAGHANNFAVIAPLLTQRWTSMFGLFGAWEGDDIYNRSGLLYHALDNKRAAHDAALMLCHWAYIYPTFTQAQVLDHTLISPASIYNRDLRLRTRYVNEGLSALQQGLAVNYDYLFDYIKGNDQLARSVNRFIPWVKTEADVRRLIETRILQFGARQSMHFNLFSDYKSPQFLFLTALVQQDPAVTRPWMEFLWNRTWIYPHDTSGLPDYISSTIQRDGSTEIGSIFYSGEGSPLADLALWSKQYVENGGDAKYDLTANPYYSKLSHAGRFVIDKSVAGGYPMSIGDVGGPDQGSMFNVNFTSNEKRLRDGYALSKDPRLAWIINEYFGRGDADDATWRQITQDCQKVDGHPLLTPNPRVMANWAGILETGARNGDFRFLTAAYLRIGTGHGHAHDDTLDLQINALGRRMVNDLGWRDSYSTPKATFSQLHNLVEVDETNWQGHAWVDTFVPGQGVSYLRAQAIAPAKLARVSHRSRAISLVEVSQGNAGSTPPAPLPYTAATRVPQDAVLPQTYLFDVQRTAGGKLHTWCFHGTISDEFTWNAPGTNPNLSPPEANYLRRYLQGNYMKFASDAPSTLVATWRLRRHPFEIDATNRDGQPLKLKQTGGEQTMLAGAFDPNAPRAFTRVHLPDHGATRAMVAHPEPNIAAVQQTWPHLFVQRSSETDLQSVFASVIEPYSGEPFIKSVEPVKTGDESTGAGKAVALRVRLVDCREDVCFSGQTGETRTFDGLTVEGQYAFVRNGPSGLEMLELVAGKVLRGPWGELQLDHAFHQGTIVGVDYVNRKLKVAGPAPFKPEDFLGQVVELGNAQHKTSFTVTDARLSGQELELTLDKPLDLSFVKIIASDPEKKLIHVAVMPRVVQHPGMSSGLSCTSDSSDKVFKCAPAAGESRAYQLEQPFTKEEFPVGGTLRVWEVGVGDQLRLMTYAKVVRDGAGKWKVSANTTARFTPSK
jgi:hypothetical protein